MNWRKSRSKTTGFLMGFGPRMGCQKSGGDLKKKGGHTRPPSFLCPDFATLNRKRKNFFKNLLTKLEYSVILYLTTPGRGYGGERISKNFSNVKCQSKTSFLILFYGAGCLRVCKLSKLYKFQV